MRPARRLLALAPVVVLVGLPALYALAEGLAASVGLGGAVAGTPIGLDAYRRIATTPGLLTSALFSLWVATASTVLAVGAGVLVSWWWITRSGRRRQIDLRLLQLNLSLPHLAWAVALLMVLSRSGWLARVSAAAGLIERPEQFPVLVQDQLGLGIIAHLASKEFAFVALATLPLATRRAGSAVRVAASLGAGPARQLWMAFLPAVAPALIPATAVVFAFGLGSYEPAAVLGVQNPRTLAVIAIDGFRDADLTRRADAFALGTLMTSMVLVALALAWRATRTWRPAGVGPR